MINKDIEQANRLGHRMIGPSVDLNDSKSPVTTYVAKCHECNSKIEYVTDELSFSNVRKNSSALNVLCKKEQN